MSNFLKINNNRFVLKISSFIIKQAFIFSILLLILGLFFAGRGFFQFKETRKNFKTKISQEEKKIQNQEKELSQINELLKNYKLIKEKEEIKNLNIALPKKDLPNLFVILEKISKESAVEISSINFSEEGAVKEEKKSATTSETISGKEINELKISLAIQGSDYQTLKKFLDNLEKSLRFFDITSITFGSSKGKISSFVVNLKTYYRK